MIVYIRYDLSNEDDAYNFNIHKQAREMHYAVLEFKEQLRCIDEYRKSEVIEDIKKRFNDAFENINFEY